MDTNTAPVRPCRELFKEMYRLKWRYSRFIADHLFYLVHVELDDPKSIHLRDKWLKKDDEIREIIDIIRVNYPDDYQLHLSEINSIIRELDNNKRRYVGGKMHE